MTVIMDNADISLMLHIIFRADSPSHPPTCTETDRRLLLNCTLCTFYAMCE